MCIDLERRREEVFWLLQDWEELAGLRVRGTSGNMTVELAGEEETALEDMEEESGRSQGTGCWRRRVPGLIEEVDEARPGE